MDAIERAILKAVKAIIKRQGKTASPPEEPPPRFPSGVGARIRCHWCDLGQHEVSHMIQGLGEVAICSECILLGHEIVTRATDRDPNGRKREAVPASKAS